MELRAFAEHVLFATSLEEKLSFPSICLTDDDPGGGTKTPDSPGRPLELRIVGRGEPRAELPTERELIHDEPRARLLHFFANHELLATELMALAILKFPEAPSAFRRGLLHTLQEEQVHTRLYMERMSRAGMTFGDLPVNGFFWNHVADMASPLDYVSRLSLTFEQANLDYAHHYAAVFSRMDDADTAGLLHRIYEDEIGHVGYGLRWFRKWKSNKETDWQAWRRVLSFPLSPARGKGNAPYNADGRRRAGLNDEWIDSLDIFSQSRGRKPDVFFFNPGAEVCALHLDGQAGLQDQPSVSLAHDLDILPVIMSHSDDIVIVQKAPSAVHVRRLKDAGIGPADWVTNAALLRERKLGVLRPWAWSYDSYALLNGLNAGNQPPEPEATRMLYSKETGGALLRALAPEYADAASLAGIVCYDEISVSEAAEKWLEKEFTMVVIKAPWSLAGRGMIRVAAWPMAAHETGWLRATLAAQGSVVVEPWLNRVGDFSVQYDVSHDGHAQLVGMVRLHCDAGGRFQACTAARSFTRILPGPWARALQESKAMDLYSRLIPKHLAPMLAQTGFHGCLGIDALIHIDATGSLQLRPVVEINPRCTMGRLTLALRRYMVPESAVTMRIHHSRHAKEAGHASLAGYIAHLCATHPIVMQDGKIVSGSLPLNDPVAARMFVAMLES